LINNWLIFYGLRFITSIVDRVYLKEIVLGCGLLSATMLWSIQMTNQKIEFYELTNQKNALNGPQP